MIAGVPEQGGTFYRDARTLEPQPLPRRRAPRRGADLRQDRATRELERAFEDLRKYPARCAHQTPSSRLESLASVSTKSGEDQDALRGAFFVYSIMRVCRREDGCCRMPYERGRHCRQRQPGADFESTRISVTTPSRSNANMVPVRPTMA